MPTYTKRLAAGLDESRAWAAIERLDGGIRAAQVAYAAASRAGDAVGARRRGREYDRLVASYRAALAEAERQYGPSSYPRR